MGTNEQYRPENLKKSRPKKLVKSNKSISRNFFWPNSIFCNFKNGQKSIFEVGKKFKIANFMTKKRIYLISQVFFAWTFLNFLAHTVHLIPNLKSVCNWYIYIYMDIHLKKIIYRFDTWLSGWLFEKLTMLLSETRTVEKCVFKS